MTIIRALLPAAALLAAAPLVAQDWQAGYSVGQKVQFSISGEAADFQPCVVAEANPGSVLRVDCQAFKHWSAGRYIVYSKSDIRAAGAPAVPARAATTPAANAARTAPASRPGAGSGALKPGEYSCTGAGGRTVIGFGFKLAANGNFTDLDGGRPGRVVTGNGQVRFVGGHMGGMVARRLNGNNFAFGQMECGPWE